MVTGEWFWVMFSSLGTGVIIFALGLIRTGVQEIKSHLYAQDKSINDLSQRVSRIEGKVNNGV